MKVGRQRAVELEPAPTLRVREAEPPGVKRLPRKGGDPRPDIARTGGGATGAGPIDRVADQRVSLMGKVNPDLMGAPGGEAAFDERCCGLERPLDAIAGQRRPPPSFADDRHLFAVCRAAADIAGDLAGGWRRHAPNKGGIGAVDPAQREIARQRPMRALGLGDDHQPAGVLVEAMNDARPSHPADAGETGAAMGDQRVDEGTVGVSRAG